MKKPLRVLLVENSTEDAARLVRELEGAGFDVKSRRENTVEGLKTALDAGDWELIVSSDRLAELKLADVLALCRERGIEAPLICISSGTSEEAAAAGIKAGAQDCMLSANLARFIPAVERQLRVAEALRKQKQAEIELKKLSTAVAHTVSCIAITDLDGVVEYVNPAFERTTGFTKQEAIGKTLRILKSGAHDRAFYERLWKKIRSGEVFRAEFINRRKNGEIYHQEQTITPVADGAGKITHFVATGRDVTERKQAEEALKESEALYHSLVETLPVHIFRKDRQGRFTFGNNLFCLSMGKPLLQILGKTDADFFPPELAEKYRRDDQRVMSTGKVWEDIEQHQTSQGERKHVHVLKVPLRDYRGELIGIQGVSWDITARKRAEEALQQSEELFSKAFRAHAVGISISRLSDGRFLEVNDAFLKMLGYERAEVVGRTSAEMELWPSPKRREEVLARLLSEKSLKNLEGRLRKKSGETGDLLYSMELVELNGEKCLLTFFNDITELKQAEERSRQQASLLDLAQDAIIVRDLDGRIQFWNKAAERLSGWTAEEVIGRNVADLVYKDREQFVAAQKQVREKGEWAGELRLVAKDGREAIMSSRWSLVRDAQGEPKALLAINTDITEKKQLETQFLRAQRMESLGMLSAGIAHDLNNILAPILMASALMRQGGVEEKDVPRILDMIRINAQRGADIIKQLLAFGRGAAGERIAVQPRHLVSEMVKMAKETFPKNITLDSQASGDLWTVMADTTQFHQVLLNLCLNARDAMSGGGTLSLSAENIVLDERFASQNLEARPGPYVLFKVADTGSGIAPDILEKIFDPFFTTKESGRGTGLGLSTVLAIAKGHGGFVKVCSEVGRGSTFAVYLPATPQSPAAAEIQKEGPPPGGRGELVLVVDDEQPIREMTREILERNGYKVLTALDGTEALALFSKWRGQIGVVLTDVSMPVMDGVTLVRTLTKMKPRVKVIAASGRGSGGDSNELKGLGIDAFLAKPYTTESLVTALHDVLASKQN